jgi:hypothetical protein
MKYKSIQWGLVVPCGPRDRHTDVQTQTDGGRTDRQTDRPGEANSYFRNFAKAPKSANCRKYTERNFKQACKQDQLIYCD